MPSTNLAYVSERREDREDVHHRTVATDAAGRSLPLLVVNISPNGLMARCDRAPDVGAALTFKLPGIAPFAATVRWALGGRIGVEFATTIPVNSYFAILPRLRG